MILFTLYVLFLTDIIFKKIMLLFINNYANIISRIRLLFIEITLEVPTLKVSLLMSTIYNFNFDIN